MASPAGNYGGNRMTRSIFCCPKIGLRHVAAFFAALLAMLVTSLVVAPAAFGATTAASRTAKDTARIQSLLDRPVNGKVNLPPGTFTVRPTLRLSQGETITGHHTTLKIAAHSGNYAAMLAGRSMATDLSGLKITGVTFDQNTAGNPITSIQPLYKGQPRFVILIPAGSHITITGNRFTNINNVNTIVTGSATRGVTISGNAFYGINAPVHDHSSIYTSGLDTVIRDNRFTGATMFNSAAIEVHGDRAVISGNVVRGYYRGANIVSSHTTFSRNTVIGAASPVSLWSVEAPGLSHVNVTNNRLNRDLPYWASVLHRLGRPMPTAQYTKMVIREAGATFPFSHITIRGNRG
jgi:hypothetical protein